MNDELKERVKAQEKPPQWFVLLKSVASCENEDVMMHMDGSMTIKPDCMERFAQAVARECMAMCDAKASDQHLATLSAEGWSAAELNAASSCAESLSTQISARYGLGD